ncbi:hypothetical protein D3C79_1025910 [compost metagenome]
MGNAQRDTSNTPINRSRRGRQRRAREEPTISPTLCAATIIPQCARPKEASAITGPSTIITPLKAALIMVN